ncbi:MAG: hypothetical protein VW600_00105 [Ferrovibrio sp.]
MTLEAPRRWEWQYCIAAGLVLAFRAVLLWQYGILEWPDSGGYTDIARQILGAGSLHDFLMGNLNISSSRTIGYPLVLAAAMAFAGPAWPWVMVGIQLAGLLWMLWWLYRLGVALGVGRGFAAFATGVFACSHLAIYEGSILTDALTTHLTVISLAMMLVPMLEGTKPGMLRMLGAGFILAYAFLIREATLYLLPVIVMVFIGVAVVRGWRPRDMARMIACFVLPAILVWQGYMELILVRTGYRCMATIGRTVYFMHPLAIEGRGKQVLRNPVLREAVDATTSWYIYGHAREIDAYLAKKYKMNEWERLALAKAAYWQAWRSYPVAMAIESLKELRPKYALLLADPSANVIDVNVTEETVRRSLSGKESIAVKLLQAPFRLFSAVVFLCCAIGIPAYVVFPRLRRNAPANLDGLAACWLLFAALIGMYAMIHMEFRHFLQVQAFAVLSGLVVLRHIALALWEHNSRG